MKPSSLWCLALVTPLAAGAAGCGSDDGDGQVEGEHYRYVVATLSTVATNKLDIDDNGRTENKLGDLVGLLTAANFGVQATVDEAVNTGSAVLLADLQTSSFSSAASAGFAVYLGDSASITPAPCTDITMLATCGQHLKGTGAFTIAASSPRDTLLTGPFAGGTMKGGPGKISLQLALTGAPITVSLTSARVQISDVSADGIGRGLIGGGVTQTELDTTVLPGVTAQLKAVIDRDCGPEAERALSGGVCGRQPVGGSFTACMAGTTGETVLAPTSGFDSTRDCKVTLAEVKAHPILAQGLSPDLMVNGQPAMSAVLGFTAKKGSFTP